MPIYSNLAPTSEDLARFRDHLKGLALAAGFKRRALRAATSLVRHRVELTGRERLCSWMRELSLTSSWRRVRDQICAALPFTDFCGIPELRQILDQTRSCAALSRALAEPGIDWKQALHQARKPSFESGLGAWLQAFLDHRTGRQMKLCRWPSALRRLDQLALLVNAQIPEHITPELLERFLSEGQTSPRYRNIKLSKLRGLQRFFESRGVEFPLPTGLGVKEPPFRPHIYTLWEIGRILRATHRRGLRGLQLRWLGIESIIFLLYACGMRLSEPLGLRICDVDLQQGTLFLHCTKFYKQRWVPLGKGAVRRLKAYWRARQTCLHSKSKPEDPFFLNMQGRGFKNSVLEREFSRIITELQLESRGTRRPRLHDLRHTLAVHRMYQWYAEGKDVQNKLPLLSAYLGHDRLHHTEVYLHLTDDLIRLAGRNFQCSFEEVVGHWSQPGD